MSKALTILTHRTTRLVLIGAAVVYVFTRLSNWTTATITRVYDDAKAAPIVLKVHEKAKVEIGRNRVRHATRTSDGKTAIKDTYVPPEGRVTVIEPKVGDLVVKVKNKGVTFSPGCGAGVVGTAGGGFGFVKFAYYKRLGLAGGLGFNTKAELVPFAGATFHVKSNTFLLFGVGSEVKLVAGLAVNF